MMKKFKRIERISLLTVFLMTVPILIYLFFYDDSWISSNTPSPYYYWIWKSVIVYAAPTAYWFSYGSTPTIFLLTFGITLTVFLPMSLNSRTRYAGAVCMTIASTLFLGFLWVYSLGVVFSTLGFAVAIFGLGFAYVGIIPLAFIGASITAFYGKLELLIPMLVLIACFAAARKIKKYALRKYEETIRTGC